MSYALLDQKPLGKKATLYVEAGLGVKAPTGAYDENLSDKNLPENFNTGLGAWGGIIQTNIGINLKNSGVALSGNLQSNWIPEGKYQFGDQWSGQAYAFHQFFAGARLKVTPYAGGAAESVRTVRPMGNMPLRPEAAACLPPWDATSRLGIGSSEAVF